MDRLVSETTPHGTMTYTYDAAGRRLTMQAGSQAQVTYTYDNANRLTGIIQGSFNVAYGYDIAGRRTSATLPGGISAVYTWDSASQLTDITYSSGADAGYRGRDVNDRNDPCWHNCCLQGGRQVASASSCRWKLVAREQGSKRLKGSLVFECEGV
jgi:YD repeat-containing protein